MGVITLAEVYAGLHYASGARWSGSVVSFSIPTADSSWSPFSYEPGDEPTNVGYGVLNADQAFAFRVAMVLWDNVVAASFVEVQDNASGAGQIRVAFTTTSDYLDGDDSAAYAYRPPVGTDALAIHGDIWIDADFKDVEPEPGDFLFFTILHEIGHALGLKHPFEGTTLPAEFNNTRYTVMAYDDFADSRLRYFYLEGGQLVGDTWFVYPMTPMPLDILAMQGIYGASTNAALGDNTYGGREDDPIMLTLFDLGGTDTYDFSLHRRGSLINLTPGQFSSVGYWSIPDQIAAWTASYPDQSAMIAERLNRPGGYTWSNNLATSNETVIENVVAGTGNDTITGNLVANNLSGGAGSDQIAGGLGDDTISGGEAGASGNYLRGDEGNDSLIGGANFDDANGNMGNDTVSTGDGNDFCVGGKDNDLLSGDGGSDLVYGNLGDDTCQGGDGADTIRGGQGADSLVGGAGTDFVSGDRGDDTMTGGAGGDIFHSSGDAGIDRVLDFNLAEGDRIQLDPGTTYSVLQSGADTIIQMTNGQVVLVGVSMSSLTAGTIFGF
ncbi:M10 family metallopeptidase [Phenylobacterium sp.]|jgi:serralysin|uniref:M10 family metallopeptidase n=1 Tax=Phenylobacterium sp. TaxID=1871053 RepID=UPI0037C7E8E1